MQYNFLEVEEKWSNYWLNNKIYKKMNDNFRPRFFGLNKLIDINNRVFDINDYLDIIKMDAIARVKRMQGFNVLHSISFNPFGLEGEKYAIRTGNNPFDYSKKNILKEIEVYKRLGISYDYDLLINMSDPEIYKWSQWLFTKLYEIGLAKNKDVDVFYADALKRIVDPHEVKIENNLYKTIKDNYSVSIRQTKKWFIDIKEFNEELLKSIDNMDYPIKLINEIKDLIGKKEGYNLTIRLNASNIVFNTFTSRIDNLFGATFCVISPNNKYVLDITSEDEYSDVLDYLKKNKEGEMDGAFTGSFAINPMDGKLMPIWVSNYIDNEYDNSFKICVPSTDELDYKFALLFGLDIINVIDFEEAPFMGDGIHTNSGFADNLDNMEASKKIYQFLLENGYGYKDITYKLKEVDVSSYLYFGEPIPIIYFNDGSIKVLNSTELPLESPNILVKPSGNVYSPLYNAKNWVNVYTKDGIEGVRELNTLNDFIRSSWYHLAYVLKSKAGLLPINSPDARYEINKWLPVDLYIGNIDAHTLIFQKFMHYALKKLDYLNVDEPFKKIINLDQMVDLDNQNIDVNNILDEFGSDVFRLFLLDIKDNLNLIDLDIYRRYIARLVKVFELEFDDLNLDDDFKALEKEVTNLYEEYDFKQIIYVIGVKINDVLKAKRISKKEALTLLKLLHPIIPFVTEELYSEKITKKNILSFEEWPILD